MANINRKRTEIARVDPKFKKWVDDLSRTKAAHEKTDIKPARITQAIYKQYIKYPELLKEITRSRLGKWKSK